MGLWNLWLRYTFKLLCGQVALYPGFRGRREREPGIHCLCMHLIMTTFQRCKISLSQHILCLRTWSCPTSSGGTHCYNGIWKSCNSWWCTQPRKQGWMTLTWVYITDHYGSICFPIHHCRVAIHLQCLPPAHTLLKEHVHASRANSSHISTCSITKPLKMSHPEISS